MTQQEKLKKFLLRGEELRNYAIEENKKLPPDIIMPSTISGTVFEQWRGELRIFFERNLKKMNYMIS